MNFKRTLKQSSTTAASSGTGADHSSVEHYGQKKKDKRQTMAIETKNTTGTQKPKYLASRIPLRT
jgi:hypothetical protein